MIKWIKPLFAFAACAVVCGCCSCKTPYDYRDNWLIREDPVRPFVVPADLIYVSNELYTSAAAHSRLLAHAGDEVGGGRFDGIARVFAPLIANSEDLEDAIDWYFKYHHEKGRCMIFIGEGVGGAMLKAYEAENKDDLVAEGLVASFYREIPDGGFVTDDMVLKIKHAITKARYKSIWGRDMPEEMLNE